MPHATVLASDGAENVSHQVGTTMPLKHLDDDLYPSSESDDQVEATPSAREAKLLLADASSNTMLGSIPGSGLRKRRTPLKTTEIIWVTLTVSLIAVLGYSSQLGIMLPYYYKTPSFSPWAFAGVLIPFNAGLVGIFYNYWLCVTTNPGHVPSGWQPEWSALDPVPSHSSHSASMESEPSLELKQIIYRPRYCKSCSAYKPPRTHHCKTCQQCVLRMDHHCPWLANCIGHYNYAHFIRFLFYVDVTCFYHLLMISARVMDKFNSYGYWREPGGSEVVWLVVNYALCIPVLVLVGCFSGYHFYCVAGNQTTIESWEKDRVATMVRRGRVRKVKYPYDLGVWRNVKEVLGANPLFWCWPGSGRGGHGDGEGLKYPVASGCDEGSQYRWPPKDPTKPTPTHHGWYGDASQAPPLFPSPVSSYPSSGFRPNLPPGATSSQPFTYGSGFNPNLRPSNSLRFRGASHSHLADNHEPYETESESDDDPLAHPQESKSFTQPNAHQLESLDYYPPPHNHYDTFYHDQYQAYQEDQQYPDEQEEQEGEEEEEDVSPPRVSIRRGSEGYEVRPAAFWSI